MKNYNIERSNPREEEWMPKPTWKHVKFYEVRNEEEPLLAEVALASDGEWEEIETFDPRITPQDLGDMVGMVYQQRCLGFFHRFPDYEAWIQVTISDFKGDDE